MIYSEEEIQIEKWKNKKRKEGAQEDTQPRIKRRRRWKMNDTCKRKRENEVQQNLEGPSPLKRSRKSNNPEKFQDIVKMFSKITDKNAKNTCKEIKSQSQHQKLNPRSEKVTSSVKNNLQFNSILTMFKEISEKPINKDLKKNENLKKMPENIQKNENFTARFNQMGKSRKNQPSSSNKPKRENKVNLSSSSAHPTSHQQLTSSGKKCKVNSKLGLNKTTQPTKQKRGGLVFNSTQSKCKLIPEYFKPRTENESFNLPTPPPPPDESGV